MERRGFIGRLGGGALLLGISGAFNPAWSVVQPPRYDRDYFRRMRAFEEDHEGDVFLTALEFKLLKRVVSRLKRLQAVVGHGNFHVLGFDEALKTARNYSRVGRFSKEELAFLDQIFYDDPSRYGFFGEKVLTRLTDRIARREVEKVPRSGQYLFKGQPTATYQRIRREIGRDVILTSGVRGVVKQMLLFLNKAVNTKGNLSRASRSLAPPGCSFHSIGDFDVGQRGLAAANFTDRFAETPVYQRLRDLGLAQVRYPQDNLYGVRYEPWHIRVKG